MTIPPAPPPMDPMGAAPQQPNNTMGLLGLILGIISIPLGFCCGLFTIPFAVAAIVLGYLGKQKAAQGQATNAGQANWGFITGIIGLVLGIIMYIVAKSVDWAQFFDLPTN